MAKPKPAVIVPPGMQQLGAGGGTGKDFLKTLPLRPVLALFCGLTQKDLVFLL